MVYIEQHMDIRNFIDGDDVVVAHCIAADLNWGSGVAPIINREIFDAEDSCRYRCSTNAIGVPTPLRVGECLPVKTYKHHATLVNLITKLRSQYKPTYESLTESLVSLRSYMQVNGKNILYMPKIGCGIDMLHWEVVSNIIKGVFNGTDVKITIAIKD